jgi:hypothetical protein
MTSPSDPGPEPKRKRGPETIVDTCFPELATLCRDTSLSDSTVRKALDNLIKWGVITKTRMRGFQPHKGQYPSKYEHNRYHVVTDVWDLVESPFDPAQKAERKAAKAAKTVSPMPASSPSVLAADQEVAKTLDSSKEEVDFPRPTESKRDDQVNEIVAMLRERFGSHSSFSVAGADQMMAAIIKQCMDVAGSADKCKEVIGWVCYDHHNPKIRALLQSRDSLGGYIRKSFPDWLKKWDDGEADRAELFESCLKGACLVRPDITFNLPDRHYAEAFKRFLKGRLGDHLLGLTEKWGESTLVIITRISDEFKEEYRATHPIEQEEQAAQQKEVQGEEYQEEEYQEGSDLTEAQEAAAEILSTHTGQMIRADKLPPHPDLVGMTQWAVAGQRWGGCSSTRWTPRRRTWSGSMTSRRAT